MPTPECNPLPEEVRIVASNPPFDSQELFDCLDRRRSEIIGLLRFLGLSREDAEDVAQEVILRVIPIIRSGAALEIPDRKRWLRRFAANLGKTLLRRQGRYQPLKREPACDPVKEHDAAEEWGGTPDRVPRRL